MNTGAVVLAVLKICRDNVDMGLLPETHAVKRVLRQNWWGRCGGRVDLCAWDL